MKRGILIFSMLIIITFLGNAQIVDKYGFNIGLTNSTQLWHSKFPIEMTFDYKTGISFFFTSEKKINKYISIRPEIGYIQKGFKDNIEFIDNSGKALSKNSNNVVFHDLGIDLGLKISPLKIKFSPYLFAGIRADYMFSYKDILFEEPGSGKIYNVYQSYIEQFNKVNLGGLLGVGMEINDKYYLEVDYNPAITNSYNATGLQIKDNCWGVKLGININKILKKGSKG